jgi:hypothetical protein
MKNPASLVLGLLMAAVACPLFASLPAVLTVKYKGQMLPVVTVIGSDPVVMVDGQTKRIRTKPVYQPQTATGFSPESVKIVSASFDGNKVIGVSYLAEFGPVKTKETFRPEINVTLQASQTLSGAFIVVTMTAPPLTATNFWLKDALVENQLMVVRALPTLAAGVEVPVQIVDPYFGYIEESDFTIQIFDGQGRQMLTNPTLEG